MVLAGAAALCQGRRQHRQKYQAQHLEQQENEEQGQCKNTFHIGGKRLHVIDILLSPENITLDNDDLGHIGTWVRSEKMRDLRKVVQL